MLSILKGKEVREAVTEISTRGLTDIAQVAYGLNQLERLYIVSVPGGFELISACEDPVSIQFKKWFTSVMIPFVKRKIDEHKIRVYFP